MLMMPEFPRKEEPECSVAVDGAGNGGGASE